MCLPRFNPASDFLKEYCEYSPDSMATLVNILRGFTSAIVLYSEMQTVVKDSVPNTKVNPAARRKARHYGLQALYQWYMTKDPVGEIEIQFLADYDFSKVDIEFFHEIIHQVPACVSELESAFSPFLDRRLDELDPIELALLRLGSFELIKRIDIPYKVAINESVALAKKFGATDGHKYINGVLDKLAREVRTIELSAAASSDKKSEKK